MDPRLERLQKEIVSAIAGLRPEQWTSHPSGKWSTNEVLEHLYLTYTGTIKGFQRVAEAGKPLATNQSWAQRGRALVVVGFGYFPSGREAPPVARPRGVPAEKVQSEIGLKISEMEDIMVAMRKQAGRAPQTARSSHPRPPYRCRMEKVPPGPRPSPHKTNP